MNLEDHSIHAWMQKYGIKTENGLPFDYKGHSFWFDVLSDWHPRQVWYKAAQIGGSLVANLKLFWAVKNKGLNSAYTLPTAHDVKEFVGGKTNMLISQNPILGEWVKDKDTIEQKQVGQNIIYFRGTFSERAALSFSSDLNIHDEVDRSDMKVVDQYYSRLQHSKYQWQWFFSNPSTEGNGVHKYWVKSDQKHWFIECSKCNTKQVLIWPDSIDEDRKCFVCTHCNGMLTNKERQVGSWQPTATEGSPEFSGYWFSLLMAPWVSAGEILNLYENKSLDYFYNFVLGLPFVGKGNKLSEDEFFANLTSDLNNQDDPVVIGMDTGLPNWYVIGNRQGVFYVGKCDSYDEIERVLRKYSKSILVIDQGGDLIGPRQLQEKYPGRVFLCYYRSDRKRMGLVEWGKGQEHGKVVVDRNRCIQLLMDELRDRRIPLCGSKDEFWEMWLHFANVYRIVEEDLLHQERFKWERSGPDHLLHAFNYWRIGMDKFGMAEGKFVGGGGEKFLDVLPSYEVKPDQTAPFLPLTEDFI